MTNSTLSREKLIQLKDALVEMAGSEEILKAELLKRIGPPWPDEYVNRDTGKVYKPHHGAERDVVYSDTPAYVLVKGSEGCHSASTKIMGIPIPEWQPGQVDTAFGSSSSTGSYLKGRADLYRVRTSHGEDVEVTVDHRFLTPTGWRPLRYLSSGNLIAAYGTPNELRYRGIGKDFRVPSSAGSRHGDGLPTPQEVFVLDKLRQLFSIGTCFLDTGLRSRFYTKCFSSPGEPTQRQIEFLPHDLLAVYGFFHPEVQGCEQSPHMSPLLDSVLPAHPLGDCISMDDCVEREYQTYSIESVVHTPARSQVRQRQFVYSDARSRDRVPSDSPLSFSALSRAPREHHFSSKRLQHEIGSTLRVLLSLSVYLPHDIALQFLDLITSCYFLLYSSADNYTITWSEMQTISFVGEGDYYDLHVPFWNHYAAHGLLHHNSGKSVLGIVKALDRVKRKCSGALISPDFPHLRRSLWLEARRWMPWDQVVDKHRYMEPESWQPYAPFRIVFKNGAFLEIGGIDEPGSWEGPNINFALMDEMRRKKTADAFTVLAGRVRIPGPGGIPPQLFVCTTPRKNWLYTVFGPLQVRCRDCFSTKPIPIQEGAPFQCLDCGSTNLETLDKYAGLKHKSRVITLHVRDNEENLQEGFSATRALVLTESQARVLIDAEWEDIDDTEAFLPHMQWWDDCRTDLPPLDRQTPIVVAMDAATGRQSSESDCFGILAVSRAPGTKKSDSIAAVRYSKVWRAPRGGKIDYLGTPHNPGPERELLRLCGWRYDDEKGQYLKANDKYNVKCVCYDPKQLHDLGMRFLRKRIAWMEQFGQLSHRVHSDTDLLNVIQQKRVRHDGDPILRAHIQAADRKLDDDGHKLRIVKREEALPIDLAICLSMGVAQFFYLNL